MASGNHKDPAFLQVTEKQFLPIYLKVVESSYFNSSDKVNLFNYSKIENFEKFNFWFKESIFARFYEWIMSQLGH